MKIQKKKGLELEERRYNGTIAAVDYSEHVDKEGKPFKYVNIFVRLDGTKSETHPDGVELRYSCSDYFSKNSKLGKFVSMFIDIDKVNEIDPEELLVGKRLSAVVQKPGDYWEFSEGSFKHLIV